ARWTFGLPCSGAPFEILHRALMLLCLGPRRKRSKIAALSGLRVDRLRKTNAGVENRRIVISQTRRRLSVPPSLVHGSLADCARQRVSPLASSAAYPVPPRFPPDCRYF